MPLVLPLLLAVVLFCVGVYGVLARRNVITLLMSFELMLNAVNLNLVAFDAWRVTEATGTDPFVRWSGSPYQSYARPSPSLTTRSMAADAARAAAARSAGATLSLPRMTTALPRACRPV